MILAVVVSLEEWNLVSSWGSLSTKARKDAVVDAGLLCTHCNAPATHRVHFRGEGKQSAHGCEDYCNALAAAAIAEGA